MNGKSLPILFHSVSLSCDTNAENVTHRLRPLTVMGALNTFIHPNDLHKGDNPSVMYFYNEYTATRDSKHLIQQVHIHLFKYIFYRRI